MALDFTALEEQLNRDRDVNNSAKVAMATLVAEVEANKGDPAKLQSIVDGFRANQDDLAASVANTTGSAPA